MCLRGNRELFIRIEDNYVGVRADCDRSFSWKEAEQLRRRGRCQFDKPIDADSSAGNASVVDETHPVFHAGSAVGNLSEIVAPKLLLFLETEGAMVGGDDLQIVAAQ